MAPTRNVRPRGWLVNNDAYNRPLVSSEVPYFSVSNSIDGENDLQVLPRHQTQNLFDILQGDVLR